MPLPSIHMLTETRQKDLEIQKLGSVLPSLHDGSGKLALPPILHGDCGGRRPEAWWVVALGLTLLVFGGVGVGFGEAAAKEGTPDWSKLVRRHLDLRPETRAQDIYKLVYQGVMGTEHAVSDSAAVLGRLALELKSVEASKSEPLFEPIHPTGLLVRVNLRPFKAAGGSAQALGTCFLQTAKFIHPSPARLGEILKSLGKADLGNKRLSSRFRRFVSRMSRHGYPALHHSDEYRERYKPAYRVVSSQCIEQLLPSRVVSGGASGGLGQ